jgi:Protein of unknown function (DUF3987)
LSEVRDTIADMLSDFTGKPADENGGAGAHASSPSANSKPHNGDGISSIVFVTVDLGLAESMRDTGLHAVCRVRDVDIKGAVNRRSAIVVYCGRNSHVQAETAALHLETLCYPDRIGVLDMEGAIGFVDSPAKFAKWFSGELSAERFMNVEDFEVTADARAKWRTKRPPAESSNGQAHDEAPEEEIIDRWPKMKPEAFHGLAGDIVKLCQAETEADPVAILLQVLVGFGNLVSRRPYFVVGGTRHYLNLFVALVGATATGRKGTSWDVARHPLASADPDWAENRVAGGLVSGEGLIFHVRDPVRVMKAVKDPKTKEVKQELLLTDAGVADKRLLIIETEMGRVLKAMNRDTSTLSDVLRQCWDSGSLRTLNRKEPLKATGAHVSVVAHVTEADVHKHLTEVDTANGFANRFLWVCTRRSKVLPEGGDLFGLDWGPIQERIQNAVQFARDPIRKPAPVDWTMTTGDGPGASGWRMKRDSAARQAWHAVYDDLSAGKPGLLGLVLSRAEAQVMRLACLYALLDCSDVVRIEHLGAAIEVWAYCSASARLVFGDGLGDPDQERLLKALAESPAGLTRTEIANDVFGKNKKAEQIVRLLSAMLTQGLIHRNREQPTKGRPVERWLIGKGTD